MNELYEYLMYNYEKKHEEVAEELKEIMQEETSESIHQKLICAYGKAMGYTQYVITDLMEATGLTRSRIKALCKSMTQEGMIERITVEDVSFLVPKI